MNKRFTEKAEKALNTSVSIAEKMGHTYIGTEHILLSLISDKDSCSAFILGKHNITYDKVETLIKEYSGTGTPTTLTVKNITPRGKVVLEASYANSLKYDAGIIGTDHILLSLLEEKGCVAIKLIRMIGEDASELKNDLLTFLKSKERKTNSFKKDSQLPILHQYGKDMTNYAKEGLYDPVVGRNAETDRIIRILSRKNKNNPCLIGEAGVGKTAIIEGLAYRIANGYVPETLRKKTIISIDLTSMVAGAKYRGDFEERIKSAIKEAAEDKNIILFIDEIHTIVGAGAAEGAIDASNILKPQLSRGEIQLIGATTFHEYHKYIEKDPALERRFQPVKIEEPTKEMAYKMLNSLKERYEHHHNVKITETAIKKCVDLSIKYMTDRFLPDKALDLLDEACAYTNVQKGSVSDEKSEILSEKLKKDKENAIKGKNFDLALEYKELEEIYISEYTNESQSFLISKDYQIPEVTEETVYNIISEIYGIKKSSIDALNDYNNMQKILKLEIIGQDNAIDSLIGALKRNELGLASQDRPKGIFMFSGESGVGKTALASSLARLLFDNASSFIRLDMSEYSEKHSVSKLIGSPPGYVGSEDGGHLTEAIRRNPYSLLLLDEIEKADNEILNIFLQIFDYGSIRDSSGKEVNFKNTIIVMTTNSGYSLGTKKSLGFIESNNNETARIYDAMKTKFNIEFLSRIDEIIYFKDLSVDDLSQIAELHLNNLIKKLNKLNTAVKFESDVPMFISKNAYVPGQGARSIIRYIHSCIERDLTDIILNNTSKDHQEITIYVENGRLNISTPKILMNK